MTITIGGTLSEVCQPIKTGTVVRLFDADCTKILGKGPHPKKWKVPRAASKSDYIAIEKANQIDICETEDFAKKHYVLRMKVKTLIKCPWANGSVSMRMMRSYVEATGPSNGVNSPVTITHESWGPGSVYTGIFETVSIGDPHSRGSTGKGSYSIKLEQIDPNPENTCLIPSVRVTATLISLGKSPYTLSGTPVTQVRNISCDPMGIASGFWTGISGSGIGLVMSLSWEVRKS